MSLGAIPSCHRSPEKQAPPQRRAPDAPISLCTYCHAPFAPGMRAELNLSPLSRGRLMQFLAQDLADVALRQGVAELDMPRDLVAGEVFSGVGANLRFGQLRIATHHEQLDDLAGALVRHADRGGLEHAGHLADHVLDLVREDLEAR